jgi:hypothetical protein
MTPTSAVAIQPAAVRYFGAAAGVAPSRIALKSANAAAGRRERGNAAINCGKAMARGWGIVGGDRNDL